MAASVTRPISVILLSVRLTLTSSWFGLTQAPSFPSALLGCPASEALTRTAPCNLPRGVARLAGRGNVRVQTCRKAGCGPRFLTSPSKGWCPGLLEAETDRGTERKRYWPQPTPSRIRHPPARPSGSAEHGTNTSKGPEADSCPGTRCCNRIVHSSSFSLHQGFSRRCSCSSARSPRLRLNRPSRLR